MTGIPLFVVDAFTDSPFRGNPAAVCLLEQEPAADWMQRVAAEMNLSETAFVFPQTRQYGLRWFTPAVEVDLCGHATIAAAHVISELAATGCLPGPLAELAGGGMYSFGSRSGTLTATQSAEGVTLDFPALPPETLDDIPKELAAALGVGPADVRYAGRSRFDVLVELPSAADVRQLQPDMQQLKSVAARGVIVTAKGDHHAHDFVSRFFAPAAGVNEDPVTGSAHCVLAPYWADQFGRQTLFGFQCSLRGGNVRMELCGDRVLLTGRAVTVVRGELTV